jgi:adenine-specific DNA-methyltransferase
MEKLKMKSPSVIQEHIKEIKKLFPDAVTEVKDGDETKIVIDFDVLKQELSDSLINDKQERYQMTWPGKKEAILLSNMPTSKSLRPNIDSSIDFYNTKNIYIEGDNLDALKIMRESYLGCIKVIYLDPPYNTGNDFVYKDDFSVDIDSYSKSSGQSDDLGNRLVLNSESNGRYHSDWLNMIYPRLKLAKDFLKDDGFVFISIDDHEEDNLIKIGKEIFGESNFVGVFPWRKRTAKSDVPFGLSQDYEWIIVFAKSAVAQLSVDGKERHYFETNDFPGRPWRVHDLTKQTTASERPNSYFTIVNPKNGEKYPADSNRTWAISKDTFEGYYKENRIVFPGDYDFLAIKRPVLRYWKSDDMAKSGDSFGKIAVSTKLPDYIGMSQDGTKEITNLFGGKVFSFPKPVSLLKYLIKISTGEDDLIMDFFSGSGTTAEAVMQLNAEDGLNRHYILVQIPDLCDEHSEPNKLGYKTICDIGIERIRKAGDSIANKKNLISSDFDKGFRVFSIDSSNMKDVFYSANRINQSILDDFISNIKDDRKPIDLIFQIMSELGILLSAKIEYKTILGKQVYLINGNDLIACFDKVIDGVFVQELAKLKPLYVCFRNSSFEDDSSSVNCEQIFRTLSPVTKIKVI